MKRDEIKRARCLNKPAGQRQNEMKKANITLTGYNARKRKREIISARVMCKGGVLDYIVTGEGNHRQALEWAEWRAQNICKDYKEATLLIVYCGNVEIAVIDIEDVSLSDELCKEIEKNNGKSAWMRGVILYAYELTESLGEYKREPESVQDLREMLLNGANDWLQYSYGGCSLIYDEDIAERLCSPSEIRRCTNSHGLRQNANANESWLDVQARALRQAANMVVRAARKIGAI